MGDLIATTQATVDGVIDLEDSIPFDSGVVLLTDRPAS